MHHRIILPAIALCLLITGAATAAELFPLSDVRLLEGPFKHAQDINAERLLKFDPERLLAPFLTEAGIKTNANPYPNWESDGLNGHTAGHYLSALANTYAATGDKRFKVRLDAMVSALARCQRANGNGYVGGVPNSNHLWAEISRGEIRAGGFHLNGSWVPWYNLHKTFAGLRDAYIVAGNEQAKDVLVGLSDWCDILLADLNEEQVQRMLACEFGGMNEVLADVAKITGDEKYLTLAKRFNHQALLGPLSQQEDRLNGWHANTQVPKVIGFEQIAQMSGDNSQHAAAEFFWETVTNTRTLAFGGNSIAEHFPSPEQSEQFITHREGPETCNTYNMLRLTELLFERSPEPRYAAFYERAVFNHILSSQHPEHGGYVYFTPARPGHYRVYSKQEKCFWCCVGSGMENHTKYGQFIYAHDNDDLYVNLFIPSQLKWEEQGVTLLQETGFPEEPGTTLKLKLDKAASFKLMVRHPVWADSKSFAVTVNGKTVETSASKPGSYFAIDRTWSNGDEVSIALPMHISTEAMPYVPEYQALLYGPILLAAKIDYDGTPGLIADAARMAHVAHGPLLPLNEAPMLVAEPDKVAELVKPVEGKPLTFEVSELVRPASYETLKLIPFYALHDARYAMYWRTIKPGDYEKIQEQIAQAEAERLALEKATVDRVSPGQQQPEADHNFRDNNSQAGIWQDRHYRHANGWFSYDMNTRGKKDLSLRLIYFGSDHRHFDIFIDGTLLKTVELKGPKPGQFMDVTYPIDNALLKNANNGKITVKFQAKPGAMAGGIFDVRLTQSDAD